MFERKNIKINKKLFSGIFLAVLAISVLVPVYQANAQIGAIASMAADAFIFLTVGWIFALTKAILIGLISLMGSGIDSVLSIEVGNSGVVENAWNLVRGFANMFFIIVLIIMAFGTIFNISGYDWRSLIAKFLIAALLINFSLVIGNLIIDWTQSLSNVFLQAIGSVGNRLAQEAQLGGRFVAQSGNLQGSSVDLTTWQSIVAAFGDIALLGIIFFSLAVLFVTTLIRIPFLWGLLIISPLAWITYMLPSTNYISKSWWKYFIGWNVFLPIYLFFIYFAVFLLSNRTKILLGANTTTIMGISFDAIFFYILIAVFLIGGAKAAMSGSMAAGAGGVAAGVWARGAAVRRAAWRGTGVPGAYKEAKDYYGREGIPIGGGRRIFGTRQGEEREAKIAGMFGVPGVREKQLEKNVSSEAQKLRAKGAHLNRAQLESVIANGTPEQKIAAAQLFAEENYGALTPDQLKNVTGAFGGNINTSLAASTLRKQKWNEMPADDLRGFLNEHTNPNDPNSPLNPNYISDPNVRSLIYNSLIERRRATLPEFEAGLGLARSSQQRANMIAKAKELLGEDFSSSDREGLSSRLTDDESRRELVKIRAQKGDQFFHDNVGDPVQSQLTAYADLFENIGERKTFLENVAKKHADNVATEMLNRGMLKDDSGNVITNTQEGLKRVLSKLSTEEKLTQDKSQYLRPQFQQAIATDMSKNINTLEKYLKEDKYATASPNIRQAEGMARNAIYASQFLGPFADELKRANELIKKIRVEPYQADKFAQYQIQVTGTARDLTDIRKDYEKLCRRNNILDASAQKQIKGFDIGIQIFKDKSSKALADAKAKTS